MGPQETSRSKAQEKKQRYVQWDTVTIYTHVMELGDNPCVSSGVPVTIGWKAESIDTFSVDQVENVLCEQPSRSKYQMCLPSSFRYEICRASGSSRSQLLFKNNASKVPRMGNGSKELPMALQPFVEAGHNDPRRFLSKTRTFRCILHSVFLVM